MFNFIGSVHLEVQLGFAPPKQFAPRAITTKSLAHVRAALIKSRDITRQVGEGNKKEHLK
jgi:hypothetical protein